MISYRFVAIASAIVAIASLAVLVVIVALRDVSILSTVALTLAILAFVVQLIVFIVQTSSASQQMQSALQLHASTQGVLGEIQERTTGTQAAITTINEKLLEHVIGKAQLESHDPRLATTPADMARQIASELQGALTQTPRASPTYPLRIPSDDDQKITELLSTFPGQEEAQESLAVLTQLPPEEQAMLAILARDEIRSRAPGAPFQPGLRGAYSKNLVDLGLIAAVEPVSDDVLKVFALTDGGRRVARLLAARGEIPEYLAEPLEPIRKEVGRRLDGPADESDD